VGEFEEAAQPGFLEFGEALEVLEAFHPADHGGQRDAQDLPEAVALGLAVAGIGKELKCFHAGWKSCGIWFIAGGFASHSPRSNQASVSYKCVLHQYEVAPKSRRITATRHSVAAASSP
jgi:hypothetical protein